MTNMPMIKDEETGAIVRRKFTNDSGFTGLEGLRQFGTLSIREGILKGTPSVFLISIRVYDQNDVLLIDLAFDKLTGYSREKVRKAVMHQLVQLLYEAAEQQGKTFDQNELYEQIDRELKAVYYSESYQAILGWASQYGIELNEREN